MLREKKPFITFGLICLILVTILVRIQNVESYLNGLAHLSHHAQDYDQDGDKDSHHSSQVSLLKGHKLVMLPAMIINPMLIIGHAVTNDFFSFSPSVSNSDYIFSIFRPPIHA